MQTKKLGKLLFFFFGKSLFECKIRFAVETKNWDNFNFTGKNFCCRHQKNARHTIFMHGNCMVTVFFQKLETWFFFHHQIVLLVQIAAETCSNLFSLIFWYCMKIV